MKLNNLIRVPNWEQGILHEINSDLRRKKSLFIGPMHCGYHSLNRREAAGGGRLLPITFDALVTGMDPCAHRADHWVALSLCLSVCPSTFLKPCEDLVNIVDVVNVVKT